MSEGGSELRVEKIIEVRQVPGLNKKNYKTGSPMLQFDENRVSVENNFNNFYKY